MNSHHNVDPFKNKKILVLDKYENEYSTITIEQFIKKSGILKTQQIQKIDEIYSSTFKSFCQNVNDVTQIKLYRNLVDTSKDSMFLGEKRVRIDLRNDSKAIIQPGALHYMLGPNLEIDCKVFKVGFGKPKPRVTGTGTIWLEPVDASTHFLIFPCDGKCIVDKGQWVAYDGTSLKKKTVIQKNISSAVLGGEGLFFDEFTGNGWILMKSKCPINEIQQIKLEKGESLWIDGDFAFLRVGDVDYSMKRGGSSLFQQIKDTVGEGWMDVYTAKNKEGTVWLYPTVNSYFRNAAAGKRTKHEHNLKQ